MEEKTNDLKKQIKSKYSEIGFLKEENEELQKITKQKKIEKKDKNWTKCCRFEVQQQQIEALQT